MYMKRTFIGLLIVSLGLAACQKEAAAPDAPAPKMAGAIAITEADINERAALLSSEDAAFAQTPIGRQNLLQAIVREKLIQADARANGIAQKPDYQKLTTQKRLALDEIYKAYTEQLLEDFWYEQKRADGALRVTDEEIDAYYKKYPYEMTVQQIIVDNAETADQVLRTLKRSPGLWRNMSRKFNVAPEIIRDEKFTFMPGEFLPEIEVIAANSSTGSVQGFFKTALGFHIIMKVSEKHLSKKDAAERIRTILENRKLDELIETLQKKYEVTIDAQHE